MTKHLGVLLVMLAAPALAQSEEEELAPLPQLKPKPKPRPLPSRKSLLSPKATTPRAPGLGKRGLARPPARTIEETAPQKTELAVRVAAEVSGAVLTVDGRELGVLPLGPFPVSPGEHLVRVARPGYAVFVRRVTVVQANTLELEAKLTPVAGVLAVQSDVPGAEVRLDGRLVGATPLEAVEVPVGTVEVVVSKVGHVEYRVQLQVAAGRDYPVSVVLPPLPAASDQPKVSTLVPAPTEAPPPAVQERIASAPPTVFQRWYFWVGVGVAVAGIATAAALGATAALPPKPYAAEQICQGKCDGCINLSCLKTAPPALSF